ncbi:MAG TPA: DUF6263 family protein [Longimicrobiaceae bacterium]|nr:DUF6263 family protein [Longimicrobiaceae bacterium]
MTRRAVAVACGAIALGSLACAGEEEGPRSVRLRFEYREGDTLTYAYQAKGTATFADTTDGGETVERAFERAMEIEEVATDVTPSGHYELSLVYHLQPDSAHRAKGLPEEIRLQLEITPRGRIVEVSGVETARPLYGDIDFQSYFEQSQPVFPERPLKVGDSWTQEVKVVSPESEPVVTTSTYVLESLVQEEGRELAVIGYDGDIYLPVRFSSSADTSAATTNGDRATSIEERIRVRGKIYFDHEAGVMRRMESKAEATFTKVRMRQGERVRRQMKIREESTMTLMGAGR